MFRPVIESQAVHTMCHNRSEDSAPTELQRAGAVGGYKHCIPTGFFLGARIFARNKNT